MPQTMEVEAQVPPVQGTTSLTISGALPQAQSNSSKFSKTGGQPISPETIHDAHAARLKQREAARYSSIGQMDRSSKLEALKNLKLNPFLIEDPHDASMNVLQRWKDMANSPEASKATPEQKQQAASNYYDKVIGPVYAQMHEKYGSGMPPKDGWMQNAYTSALKWDMDNAYDSHWRSGLYSGFKDFENMFSTGLTILGGLLSTSTAQTRAEAGQAEPVQQKIESIQKQGAYKTLQDGAAEIPFIKHTIDSVKHASSVDGFWHDINPDLSIGQKAKSFAVELAMQLPLYSATGGFTSGIIEGAGAGAVPLTQMLKASNLGSTALKLLVNGSEGAMYGYSMADDADKTHDAVQGAITQAILGSIFHVKGSKVKLSEAATPARAAELTEQTTKAEAAVKGWTVGDSTKLANAATEAMRDSSLAGGRPWLGKVINAAFKHVRDTEHLSGLEQRNAAKTLFEADPAKWKHSLIVANWIRTLIPSGTKIAELSGEDKQNLMIKLLARIKDSDALVDAGIPGEVDQNIKKATQTSIGKKVVQDVGEQNFVASNKAAAEEAVRKGSKKPIDEALDIAEKRGSQVKSGMPQLPTDIRGSKPKYGYQSKLFDLKFEDPRDLAAYSLSQTTKNKAHDRFLAWYKNILPESGIQDHAARVRAYIKNLARDGDPTEGPISVPSQVKNDPGRTKVTTQYRGSGANRSVAVRYEQQWIASASKKAKAAGYTGWKDWLKDLSPQDFSQEVYDIFYPKSLKDIGMDHVESGNVKNMGKENPNLLAFMYNFRDRMPKEVSTRLREELIDTFKVQEGMNGRALDEPQLLQYAHGMKAHMDELLTTEKFKNPNIKGEVGNLYRSTYEDMKEPSEHQLELHEEVIDKERELITGMFKGKPQQAKEALTAYNLLAGARLDAFEAGEQKQRLGLHDDIDNLLVKLSKGKLEKWEY